uniref:Putative PD-(D/E)XK nuclease superfamily protein n=1 Tax=viral metagenome TaxID=1070528 RepID=A0A6M3JB44_9ZZZZ
MIQPHPSWQIIDSTKIKAYMDCPRAYFYEYILGWRGEQPNIHLEFGKAWHFAMEHLLLHGTSPESIADAWMLLSDYYRQFWGPEWDESNHPKTPGNALLGLQRYAEEYPHDKQIVLYTEIAGRVAVDARRVLHFRMDSLLQMEDGLIRSREHKTGTALSRTWVDQWSLSVQTGTYTHVQHCLYPPEQVWGVEINGTFFSKKDFKFQRVPVRRTLPMMRDWHWTVLQYMDFIEWDIKRMQEECKESDPVMMCFTKNTENCTKYFGCKYHDFCMAWPNPLQRVDEIPQGMKIEYWDPSDEESKAKKVFDFTKPIISKIDL